MASVLSILHGDRGDSQPVLGDLPIRWMNLPYGVIFENDNSAFLKLIEQPMFSVDSGVEGHDSAPESCDASRLLDVQESFVKFFA